MKGIPADPYARATHRDKLPMYIAAVLAVLFLIWYTGAFDKLLYHAGLNKNECARNLISGAVFCGDELEQIERQRENLRRELRDLGR